MDIRHASWTSWRPRGDPTARHPDGGSESGVWLHADPRRVEECWAPRRSLDDRTDPQGPWLATRPRPARVLADIPPRALGRDRRRGFLHNAGVDVARLGDVLHALRDRSRVKTFTDLRFNITVRRDFKY